MDILQQLMEGGAACDTNPEDVKIDPATEKEIEESTMPIDMLIETFYINTEIELNRALEVYEMACIIGSAQVLQEGTNVQESAAAVMEGNDQGFFAKIIEKLDQIKNWFVGIVKKIANKFKYSCDVKKIKSALSIIKEQGAPISGKYHGYIFNPDGDKYYKKLTDSLNKMLCDLATEARGLAMEIYSDGTSDDNDISVELLTVDGVCEKISKEAGVLKKTQEELIEEIMHQYGVDDSNTKEGKEITQSMIGDVTKFLRNIKSVGRDLDYENKMFDRSVEFNKARIENVQQAISHGSKTVNPKIHTIITRAVSNVNTIASVYTKVTNSRTVSFAMIRDQYITLLTKQQKGGDSVEESMSMSYFTMNPVYLG